VRSIVDTDRVGDGVQLEGDQLRATVDPDAGAKILDVVHLETGEKLLWQNARVPLRRTYAGAGFDDVWCGRWDEPFPTEAPCEVGYNTLTETATLECVE
jgi:hypothetical protein